MQDRVRRMMDPQVSASILRQALAYIVQEVWHDHARRNLGTECGTIQKKEKEKEKVKEKKKKKKKKKKQQKKTSREKTH